MNKLLTSFSRLNDFIKDFAGLALLDKDVSGEEPDLSPLVNNFTCLSLTDAGPAGLIPLIKNLDRLSLTEKKPAQTNSALPHPQRRSDLVENRNARSLAGNSKNSTEKVNVEAGGHRPPLAPRPLVPNQNVQPATLPKVTAAPFKTLIPTSAPQASDTPTKPAFAPTSTAAFRAPRQHSDSDPEVAAKSSKSVVTGPDERALNITPIKPPVGSSPPSHVTTSSPRTGSVQCSGIAKTTKRRCLNRVKLSAACSESHLDPTRSSYCHWHKKEILSQDGFFPVNAVGKEKRFVKFSDHIPAYLQEDTKLKLRLELVKPPSQKDASGYVYAFEIRNPNQPDVIQLKVGRTINLIMRLKQWDDQCGPQSHIPRGWWPGKVEVDGRKGGSPLKGNIKPGDPGPLCHRVERLVHIELSDLSLHAPYLRPEWPNLSKPPSGADAARSTANERCLRCGKVHKEIFTFRRPEEGRHSEMEWNEIVKPVIKKWGDFVKEYYT